MGIEKKYDVTALGELLIDFTESGLSEQGNKLLEVNPGGKSLSSARSAMICSAEC